MIFNLKKTGFNIMLRDSNHIDINNRTRNIIVIFLEVYSEQQPIVDRICINHIRRGF